jgi:hypothetical protein
MRIRKQDQNAVASRYALREQRIPHTIGKRREFCVRDLARFAGNCDSFWMLPSRLIQKMLCHVEMFRQFHLPKIFSGHHFRTNNTQ